MSWREPPARWRCRRRMRSRDRRRWSCATSRSAGRRWCRDQLVETRRRRRDCSSTSSAQHLDFAPLEKQALLEAAEPGRAGAPPGRRPRVPPRGAARSTPAASGADARPTDAAAGLAAARTGMLGSAPPCELEPPAPVDLASASTCPRSSRGVVVTDRHFGRNLTLHTLHLFGVARDRRGDGDDAVSGASTSSTRTATAAAIG